MSYLDQRMATALAGSGHKVEPTPQTRNSDVYQGRPPCCGSATCIPICPVQAKYDATVHVTQAEPAGAELVEQAVVHFVETGADGRVSGVRYKEPGKSEYPACLTCAPTRATGTALAAPVCSIDVRALIARA